MPARGPSGPESVVIVCVAAGAPGAKLNVPAGATNPDGAANVYVRALNWVKQQ